MSMDLDPFLVALSTIVDDLSQQHAAPAQPLRSGPRPTVADSAGTGAVCPMVGEVGARLSALRAGALAILFPARAQPKCL